MKTEFKLKSHKSGETTLAVKGDLTVPHSIELKERLNELMIASDKGSAEISMKEVTAIDVSAIQLIYAVVQNWKQKKKKFSLVWPGDESVTSLITKSGLKQIV